MEPMGMRLRAVVVGAGWAGEGHTLALRDTGVEVVAICARNAEVVGKVAERLGVPEGSTDWREAIARLRPEIVAIGTPGSVRRGVVEAAVAVGAHILCDKPLALTGEDAADVYRMVRTAGVRHAYASTHQYNPSVAWVRELLGQGIIGVLQQVQVSLVKRFPLIGPWVWLWDLASGGGILNNGATHVFGILERLVGGEITGATGWADRIERMLPDIPGTRVSWGGEGLEFTPEAAAQYPQRMADADMQHVMLLRMSTATGDVHGTLHFMTFASSEPNRWRLMGTTGELVGYGVLGFDRIVHVPHGGGEATEHPVPDRFVAALPGIENNVQRNYTALVRDFVADIRNEPHASYPTFRDGWRYQVAIDAIRNSRGIPPVPHDL